MARSASILVIDDDPGVVAWLLDALPEEGFVVTGETSARRAIERIHKVGFDVVVSDIEMPEMRGLDLLSAIHQARPGQPVVLITAFGSIDLAVESVRAGAADFIAKPFRSRSSRWPFVGWCGSGCYAGRSIASGRSRPGLRLPGSRRTALE